MTIHRNTATAIADLPSLLQRPPHHLGFVVPDLPQAIDHWVNVYGAGPFYILKGIVFDECASDGAEATFDHSSAFGQWGPIPVELMQFHQVAPPRLAERLSPFGASGLHHIAIAVDDPDTERARLESLGMPTYLHARLGDIDLTFHDATHLFGCSIEVHQANQALTDHFEVVTAGAQNWDGAKPARSF